MRILVSLFYFCLVLAVCGILVTSAFHEATEDRLLVTEFVLLTVLWSIMLAYSASTTLVFLLKNTELLAEQSFYSYNAFADYASLLQSFRDQSLSLVFSETKSVSNRKNSTSKAEADDAPEETSSNSSTIGNTPEETEEDYSNPGAPEEAKKGNNFTVKPESSTNSNAIKKSDPASLNGIATKEANPDTCTNGISEQGNQKLVTNAVSGEKPKLGYVNSEGTKEANPGSLTTNGISSEKAKPGSLTNGNAVQ